MTIEYELVEHLTLPSLVTRVNALIEVPGGGGGGDGTRQKMVILSDGQSNAGANVLALDWSADLQPNFKGEWLGTSFTTPATAFTAPDTSKINFPRAVVNHLARLFPQADWYLVTCSVSGLSIDHWTRGIQYRLDSTTTAAGDPGSGYIRLNSATPALATQAYVSERDIFGNLRPAALNLRSTTMRIESEADPAVFYQYTVPSYTTDVLNPTWRTITPLTAPTSAGTIADEALVRFKGGDDMRVIEDANIPAALAALGKTAFDYVYRWQGESDSAYGNTYYRTDSAEWIQRWRTKGYITEATQIAIMGCTSTAISGEASRDIFNSELQAVTTGDPDRRTFVNSAAVSTTFWDPSGSHLHPTAAGYLLVGQLAAESTFLGWGRKIQQGLVSNLATGQVILRDGSETIPAYGFLSNPNVGPRYLAGGTAYFGTDAIPGLWLLPGTLQMNREGGSSVILLSAESNTEITEARYTPDASPPIMRLQKSRGTIASPAAVVANDVIAFFDVRARGATTLVTSGRMKFTVTEPTPSDAAMATAFSLQLSALGGNTLGDTLMVSRDAGMAWALSTQIMFDQNRLFRARIYTVGTLPTAGTQGRIAAVSDATTPTYLGALTGGGAVKCQVYDNGTAWVSC